MILSGKLSLTIVLVAAGLGFVIALAQSPGIGGASGNVIVYTFVSNTAEEEQE